ncbi:MAG: 50S ribosomal protein L30 [Schleiferiaceae bacterium]|jgi:large subunit ribosomal protein L30|nr:50S ribosomal protein L30 [Schleiferiaceae bacterium]
MGTIKITKVKSVIKRPKDQKATMKALGLNKMNQSVVKESNPAIDGMVRKIAHLVRVEEVK